MERTVKRLSLPQIMLRCMSLLLAPFDVRRDAAIRLQLGANRTRY
jgi:hypothetical protein